MDRKVVKNNIAFNVVGSAEHWDAFQNNRWESETFAVLDSILRPDDVMLDIGAWIGPISLYAGQKVKACYSFEPDPVAFKEFTTNLALNPNLSTKIFPINKAITTDGQPVKLYSKWSHGDSGSSLLRRVKSKNAFVEVQSTTFQQLLLTEKPEKIDFIKMDIEGGEFIILPTLMPFITTSKPTLLLSFHFAALIENYELKYFPYGLLRRIYRFIDPSKNWIKGKANAFIHQLLQSMDFYNVYNEHRQLIDREKFHQLNFEDIDMLLFTTRKLNHS